MTAVRISPNFYIHVLDQNSNITRLEVGPKTFIFQDHERLAKDLTKMILVPPMHYCIILNPVVKQNGIVCLNKYGEAVLAHSDEEVRFHQEPFPLYPGEILLKDVQKLTVVKSNTALVLKSKTNFTDSKGVVHHAGDQWLFRGPGTYIPRKEVEVVETKEAIIIHPNQALKLCASRDLLDSQGTLRVTGDKWLVKMHGAYLPDTCEVVEELVEGIVITDKVALHLRAQKTFTDEYGKLRKNGEEWLVTSKEAEMHIPNVYEEFVGMVDITTLTNRQYCVILDPADEKGQPRFGRKKLVKGEKSFFLLPFEHLENGIQDMFILSENEGLILRATEEHKDAGSDEVRLPGDRWMIKGPAEFIPPLQVEVVQRQLTIPLDENEGIYVRNFKTGKIRAVIGQTYMLTQDEELWEKELPPAVERLLSDSRETNFENRVTSNVLEQMQQQQTRYRSSKSNMALNSYQFLQPAEGLLASTRNKCSVVTYSVPHNAAVQIYDYQAKRARVCFGPELVMLAPDEQFTQLSLSGGRPKKLNAIKSLCLLLGPAFSTDIITVETADHARLSLQLSYNWHFDVKFDGLTAEQKKTESLKLFSVPDFIGDMCKAVASRIRGAVASVHFDDFHKNSAKIIRVSVFGLDDNQKVCKQFAFDQNRLVITNIDIQSVEPVDERTRDSLLKSVQLAIEITTSSVEATARHEAERLEQEARGRLERQKILDEAEAEKSRRNLLELRALSEAVASTGQAKAEAQSHAEAARIEGETAVEQAKLRAAAQDITANSELERLKNAREAELSFERESNHIDVDNRKKCTEVEVTRYQKLVEAIGPKTLLAISKARPELEVRMLQALNLRSTLITDGSNPINLFTTAQGLLGSRTAPNA